MDDTVTSLRTTLSDLRQRIDRVRRRKESIGEQNTKAVLIEPLLSALGWNLLDLSEVVREYRHRSQDNPVDYALFVLRSPCLFVEAKGHGTNLRDRKWVSQTLGYATVVGVEWCVLTDGDEYHLYNAHAPVEVEEKLFRVVRVSDPGDAEFTAATLDLLSRDNMGDKRIDALWKAHFVDCHVKLALESLLSGDYRNLVNWIHRERPELSRAEIRESLKRADVQVEFPVITVPPTQPAPSTSAGKEPSAGATKPKTRTVLRVAVSDLIEADLIVPPLELERAYKGHRLKATILHNGSVSFAGEAYSSLSTAAGMARKSIIGAPRGRDYPQTNGWTFWRYRDPQSGELREVDVLRQRYLKGTI